MATIPRDPAIDSTLDLLRDGYAFIWNRCQRYKSDIFSTRVLGKPTICLHGPEAAALFYDESKFARHGALPRRVVTSLFGKNAVHTLDDADHKARKSAFLSLMSDGSIEQLMDHTANAWRRAIRHWEGQSEVALLEATQCLLTEAVCAWAGVPLDPSEVSMRAQDFARMVDAFGGVGPRLWKGKLARLRTERWASKIIKKVRRKKLSVPRESALYTIAHHRDRDGRELDLKTAAVELINILRPTVAVSWYIAFAALALHQYPEAREKIVNEPHDGSAGNYTDNFMQEVRRFYPFAPYLGARARTTFSWKGYEIEAGTLALIDVYGANHDPRLWVNPDQFNPDRFAKWSGDTFSFIPQGGGDHARGHRCPGEWITMHNVTLALHFLTHGCRYEVSPSQDLTIDLSRMPARPASGLLIRNVRATDALDAGAPRLPSRSAVHGIWSPPAAGRAPARTDGPLTTQA